MFERGARLCDSHLDKKARPMDRSVDLSPFPPLLSSSSSFPGGTSLHFLQKQPCWVSRSVCLWSASAPHVRQSHHSSLFSRCEMFSGSLFVLDGFWYLFGSQLQRVASARAARFHHIFLHEFQEPAWAVGSYSTGQPADGRS